MLMLLLLMLIESIDRNVNNQTANDLVLVVITNHSTNIGKKTSLDTTDVIYCTNWLSHGLILIGLWLQTVSLHLLPQLPS